MVINVNTTTNMIRQAVTKMEMVFIKEDFDLIYFQKPYQQAVLLIKYTA